MLRVNAKVEIIKLVQDIVTTSNPGNNPGNNEDLPPEELE